LRGRSSQRGRHNLGARQQISGGGKGTDSSRLIQHIGKAWFSCRARLMRKKGEECLFQREDENQDVWSSGMESPGEHTQKSNGPLVENQERTRKSRDCYSLCLSLGGHSHQIEKHSSIKNRRKRVKREEGGGCQERKEKRLCTGQVS